MTDFPRGGARGVRAPLMTAPAESGGHARRRRRTDRERPGVRAPYFFDRVVIFTAARKAPAADRSQGFTPPDSWPRYRVRHYGQRRSPSKLARRMMTSLGVRNTSRY